MQEMFLLVIVLGIFAVGFLVMAQVDRFLNENRKSIEKETETKKPACIMLTEDLPMEDIVKEIQDFRKNHGNTRIIMYGGSVEKET